MGRLLRVRRLYAGIRLLGVIVLPAAHAGCMTANSVELVDDRQPVVTVNSSIAAMDGPVPHSRPRPLSLAGDKDTLFHTHGTNQPWSIGRAVSSGCIRMFNQDAVDLHIACPKGTQVIVLPATPTVS